MKRIPIAEALLVALAMIALLTIWFAWNEHRAVKKLQVSLQVDGSRMVLNTFFRELEDYAKKNPDLAPILQNFGAPAAAAVQATSKK
jgi:hypothetical protein